MHRDIALFAAALFAASCTSTGDVPAWRTALSTGHPLAGKVWRVKDAGFVAPAALIDALAGADFVFLGEKHDNPDHHRLQAWILESLAAAGKRPAVVWEMIGEDRQPAIDAHIANRPGDAGGLGAAVDWNKSGWPPWREYQLIADAALAHGLPIVAGSLQREMVKAVGRGGLATLPEDRRARLGLDRPLPKATVERLLDIVTKAHCGLMPRTALDPMIAVQRARDAVLADNMVRGRAKAGGAVLIAGAGHTRRDLGAPRNVAALAPGARMVSVALIEVDEDETDPARYAASFSATALPFDYAWFTPRANDRDYCAALRERFEGKGKGKEG